jgi:hypothetical protein
MHHLNHTVYEYRTYDNYIRYGVRNFKGFVVYTSWSFEDCVNAIDRKIKTGSYDKEITQEQAAAYMASFAARLEEDAKNGFTRD